MNPTPQTVRQAAYTATANALASGLLKKPRSCQRCRRAKDERGAKVIYAHHADYSKPLEVQWLCGSCHKKTHIEAGEVTRQGRVAVRKIITKTTPKGTERELVKAAIAWAGVRAV